MVRKLRARFTQAVALSLLAVLVFFVLAINFLNYYNFMKSSQKIIDAIIENDGQIPVAEYNSSSSEKDDKGSLFFRLGFGMKMTEETPYETRYFIVRLTPAGKIIKYDLSHTSSVSLEEAETVGLDVLEKKRDSGVYESYRYYRHETKGGAAEIVFLCSTMQIRYISFITTVSLVILTSVLIIVTSIVWFSSKRIVKPFAENFENQKRFITDASHEIKTPLAIIDANAEVLKLTTGENEWIDSIQNQTARLSMLIRRLVSLSKNEERSVNPTFEEFDLSEAVIETVTPFEAVAKKNELVLVTDIAPDIILKGDEASIRQVVEIFLDNAIKYSAPKGSIILRLTNKGKTTLEVTNSCEGLDVSKLENYFDRFYRADDSRSRMTGGYGIGLSIAKAVADKHKAKISVASEGGDSITFSVVF